MVVTRPRSDVTAIEDLGADTAGLCVVTRPRSDVTAIKKDFTKKQKNILL